MANITATQATQIPEYYASMSKQKHLEEMMKMGNFSGGLASRQALERILENAWVEQTSTAVPHPTGEILEGVPGSLPLSVLSTKAQRVYDEKEIEKRVLKFIENA